MDAISWDEMVNSDLCNNVIDTALFFRSNWEDTKSGTLWYKGKWKNEALFQ
jgi:hypothetical protein